MRRPLLIAAAFAVSLVATWYLTVARPFMLEGRQIANHARCQTLDAYLREYFQAHGQYPPALADALPSERLNRDALIDNWGNALVYRSDGHAFLLVSYGRDGEPDGTDHAALRDLGDHPADWDICGKYDADEVMSDRGWHRLCGK